MFNHPRDGERKFLPSFNPQKRPFLIIENNIINARGKKREDLLSLNRNYTEYPFSKSFNKLRFSFINFFFPRFAGASIFKNKFALPCALPLLPSPHPLPPDSPRIPLAFVFFFPSLPFWRKIRMPDARLKRR